MNIVWWHRFSARTGLPTTTAIAPQLTTPELAPTAIGVLNAGSTIGGAGLPWVAGAIAQATGIWTLMPYTVALAVVQIGVWRPLAARIRVAPADPGTGAADPLGELSRPVLEPRTGRRRPCLERPRRRPPGSRPARHARCRSPYPAPPLPARLLRPPPQLPLVLRQPHTARALHPTGARLRQPSCRNRALGHTAGSGAGDARRGVVSPGDVGRESHGE